MGLRGIIKFFAFRTLELAVILLVILFLPNIPPYTNFSKSFKTVAPKLEDRLSPNNKLNDVEIWHRGDFVGPEAFADYKGELYTSIHGGDVVKLSGNHITPVIKFGKPCAGLYEEAICGRPLGMQFDNKGYLYVADAYYGIFKVNVVTGDKERLVSPDKEIDGKKPKLFNSVAVASNFDIYWTDSSTEFLLEDGVYETLSDGHGRLIHYDAKTGRNTVLIKDLIFSNGVALSEDEDFVIVAETARNRVLRYYLKGSKKGTRDVFIDQLPGMPDNLKEDGKGGFFIPLVVAVDDEHRSLLQAFGPFPRLRKLASRVMAIFQNVFAFVDRRIYPSLFAKKAAHFVGHFSSVSGLVAPRVTILHVSKTGEILDAIHSLDGKISGISEAHIFKDHLYLGSPFNDYIARIPLSKIGWEHLKKREVESKPATPKPTTTTPKPTTTTTPKPTTTTPKPTTTPKSTTTTTTPKPTTTTPKPATTTTPKPTSATPKPTTTSTTPKPTTTTTTTPKPTTTTPKPTTTTPKPATTTPKPSKPATKPTEKPVKPAEASSEEKKTSQTAQPKKSQTVHAAPAKEQTKSVPIKESTSKTK